MNYSKDFYHTELQNSKRKVMHSMNKQNQSFGSKLRKAFRYVALCQAEISLLK